MGVGSRTFQTFLCDCCGREVVAEEGAKVDGYFLEVLQVKDGKEVGNDNVYACSVMCIERAVSDSLRRETLPEDRKITATQELWLRGQVFRTDPSLPLLAAADKTQILGTAREISSSSPSPSPRKRESLPLEPTWDPQ